MGEYIAIGLIVLIVGYAVYYIIKAKKSGRKCIGCPDGCNCNQKKESSSKKCGCEHCHCDEE